MFEPEGQGPPHWWHLLCRNSLSSSPFRKVASRLRIFFQRIIQSIWVGLLFFRFSTTLLFKLYPRWSQGSLIVGSEPQFSSNEATDGWPNFALLLFPLAITKEKKILQWSRSCWSEISLRKVGILLWPTDDFKSDWCCLCLFVIKKGSPPTRAIDI